MIAWLRQHGMAATQAGRRIRHTWTSFLGNALVIAAVLVLPFAGLTLLDNLLPLTSQLATEPELTVFLRPELSGRVEPAAGTRIRQLAREADPGAAVEYVSRERALASLKRRTSIGEAVAVLGENPLPDAWVVKLPAGEDAATRLDQLASQLAKVEGVDRVQVDAQWTKRLAALLGLLRLVLAALAFALAVVVLAVVFNTVRLQVLTQREEIRVCRLCGATDAFISRPFYYAGALLGLAAGALALAGIAALLPWVNGSVATLAGLYGSAFRLAPLPGLATLGLLLASLLLGALGAGLSVRRHLARD